VFFVGWNCWKIISPSYQVCRRPLHGLVPLLRDLRLTRNSLYLMTTHTSILFLLKHIRHMTMRECFSHIWQFLYYITHKLYSTIHHKTCWLTPVYDKHFLSHIWQFLYYITHKLYSTIHHKTCWLTPVYDKHHTPYFFLRQQYSITHNILIRSTHLKFTTYVF